MTKSDIPVPVCATCGVACQEASMQGETSYVCRNCGTEMKYRPAGELLNSGGSAAKENNGWAMSFSVRSTELQTSRSISILGILILLISLSFLWFGKIGIDAALWAMGSGILLTAIGLRKIIVQKKKTRVTVGRYPYWNN